MSKRGIGPGETQDTETDTRLEVARKTARMNTHENSDQEIEMDEQAGPSNSHSWKGRLRNSKSRDISTTAPSKISSKAAAKVSKVPSSRATSSDGPSTASKATSTSRNKKKKNTPAKSTIALSNEKKDPSVKDQSVDNMEITEEEEPEEELDPEMVKAAIEWNNQRDRESDMAVYMDRFEKYEVASILKEHFPTKVPDIITEGFSTRNVSIEALALAKALINKATLLHLAHLPSLSAKFQKPPACSPQVLAYLTYLSAKIAEPSLSPKHLEETMKLFSDFEPTYGPLVLLDILQDEIGHLRFITEEELKKREIPKEDIPEMLFDDLLRFKDVLETDCKVFLVLFLGPSAYNSQDIVEE
ncbi:hypothetical protein GCK72_025683 [Caenorhabditis remanei]|uniref:Uncharacterized protein n=1 Tax=Caenorhabditis remanei TaxID=31234 RepID=A0A6A5G2U6_CAERE|nr:hypothetical protein GCK72_025683 [Caenorhabditis remanei]KAF1749216.1 hypothetical protein GCK72_025683 [Caenorhabditis remanei]